MKIGKGNKLAIFFISSGGHMLLGQNELVIGTIRDFVSHL
jgi:hypothetical protein